MPIKKIHASNNMNFSSTVNEIIRAISLIFFMKILYTKKAYKAPKQHLLRYFYTPKSIIKHTGDFHLDITSRSIKSMRLFAQNMHKDSSLMM